MKKLTLKEELQSFIESTTLSDARKWESLEDQYVFCLDLYGLSADSRCADWFVERMEAHFQSLLKG